MHNVAGAQRSLEDLLPVPAAQCAADAFAATPAMAARSLWVILCRTGCVPVPRSSPRWRANSSRARATRARTVRKLDATMSSSDWRRPAAKRRHDIDVQLGMAVQHLGEGGAADEGEHAVPTARTVADLGRPSIIASSPTIAPGPGWRECAARRWPRRPRPRARHAAASSSRRRHRPVRTAYRRPRRLIVRSLASSLPESSAGSRPSTLSGRIRSAVVSTECRNSPISARPAEKAVGL